MIKRNQIQAFLRKNKNKPAPHTTSTIHNIFIPQPYYEVSRHQSEAPSLLKHIPHSATQYAP
ncbi:hypothetical protein E2C01_049316 [Portunus trituberculatus]|uniref:Uncharacterized protein n=1 Tax=Portunus trituberculatus TaxID=210409 RepID=A0A5B7G938_PORTR|nr:hypothetical protein [Portunus trituberculatus]